MTPSQKANDLVDQFRMILMQEDTDCGNECLCTLIAIKNAEIVANEVMKFDDSEYHNFWCLVVQELKRM